MSKEKMTGKGKLLTPIVSMALVGACTIFSLSGYEAPIYAVEAEKLENNTENAETETEVEEVTEREEVIVKGNFELEDGVYKGSGTGFAGKVTVSVEVKDGSIADIEVLSNSDDAAFFNRAKSVIDEILKSQSFEVDTVSGATYSSKGIINAVKNALTGEKDTSKTGNSQSAVSVPSDVPKVEIVEEASAYKDGSYYGTGTGFGGTLKVGVVISEGKISSIQIMQHSDDNSYISSASSVISQIISNQSTNVDTVSGATYSSAGIIQAVRSALSQAAMDFENTEQNNGNENGETNTENDSEVTGTVPYAEGIYFGTGEGYLGDITVSVVIQEETIKAILINENEDDEAFFNRAMDVVKNVIKQQNTEVDTVSGATYSSQGLIDAIKEALSQAEKVTNGEIMETLKNAIAEAEMLNEADYTELSWSVLQIRLEDAKEALDFSVQKYAEIAEQKLRAAIEELVVREDVSGDEEDNTGNEEDSDTENDGDKENDETPLTKYQDGIYEATVLCVPDEWEDFESYNLTLKITVENDKIIAVTDVSGDGDSSNDRYIKMAVEGTSKYAGVVTQIIGKGTMEDIDAVTRATCSSKSIIEACEKALESAIRQ